MSEVATTPRRFSAPCLLPGDCIMGRRIKSVAKYSPYDILPGRVSVRFVGGGGHVFNWTAEVPETEMD